jgi:hypothetical protein
MLLLIPILLSCGERVNTPGLYNIDSLVSAQVKELAGSNATLYKSATIGTITDSSSYQPADSAWNSELEIFRQLDVVNKPVNRSNYIIDDGLYDVRSNLTVKAISATGNYPVRYIRIFYNETSARPRKIEALYQDKNILSETSRLLTMEFQQVDNKNLLTAYSIRGGQQMLFGDTVAYQVEAKIVLD